MLDVLTVVLPVFLIVGAGYLAVRFGGFQQSAVDGLLAFTVRYAVPVFLFNAMYRLDLSEAFARDLLASFYTGALTCFALGTLLARLIWNRRPGESVAIGFGALFSNTVLLGLPIMERAFGPEEMAAAFAIVAIHAPICYFVGIVVMEICRADGHGPLETARRAARLMFSNALTIGLALGLAANFAGLRLPEPAEAAIGLLARAALPVALFAVGGALTRYALRSSLGEAGMVAALSTLLHPAIAYALGRMLGLSDPYLHAAVLLAAMPPGMNAYVFATMYRRSEGAAASGLLLATATSVLTIPVWLLILA